LWPCSLEELSPELLDSKQGRGWRYEWASSGDWRLFHLANFPNDAVCFSVRGETCGWKLTNGIDEKDLDVEAIPENLKPLSQEETRDKMIARIKRRVSERPFDLVHVKGLVSLLFVNNRIEEAKECSQNCLSRLPEHWWPNYMYAISLARLGKKNEAEKHMLSWTNRHERFWAGYFLSQFYAELGADEKALHAIRRWSHFSMEDVGSDYERTGENLSVMTEALVWERAVWCYNSKTHDVVELLCSSWRNFYKKEWSADICPSFYCLMAASHLAKREFELSEGKLEMARSVLYKRKNIVEDIRAIEAAIREKNAEFVYRPSDAVLEFAPLIEYK